MQVYKPHRENTLKLPKKDKICKPRSSAPNSLTKLIKRLKPDAKTNGKSTFQGMAIKTLCRKHIIESVLYAASLLAIAIGQAGGWV